MSQSAEILDVAVRKLHAGRRVALAAVVATRGSTPQPPGALICVDEEGRTTGTLGGGCVEAEIRRRAWQSLQVGSATVVTFDLDHDHGYDDGMICGGQMDVAIDVFSDHRRAVDLQQATGLLRSGRQAQLRLNCRLLDRPVEYVIHLEAQPVLLIAGAGHIARVLAAFAVRVGFRVTVVDERAEYASARRFPPPMHVAVGDIAATLRRLSIDAATYVVIVTRGHRHDEAALAAVLDSPARYIGMIGSRRKIDVIYEDLRAAGVADERLQRVHAPIGLDIGAVTAEEIALSIAAHLVAVRRQAHPMPVEGPFCVGETVA